MDLIKILLIFSLIGFISASSPITLKTEYDINSIYDYVSKTIEISKNSLNTGYVLNLEINPKAKVVINDQFSFLLYQIENDRAVFASFGSKFFEIIINESKMFDIDGDLNDDIFLKLLEIKNESINLYLQNINKNNYDKNDYKELFDIDVGVSKEIVYDIRDLTVYIRFINFGKGPSRINIVYSILDHGGNVLYTVVDDKVVYSEESIIKKFDYFSLNSGMYLIRAEIFYGNNQTAVSEKNFEIIENEYSFNPILLFFTGFLVLAILIYFFRKKAQYQI